MQKKKNRMNMQIYLDLAVKLPVYQKAIKNLGLNPEETKGEFIIFKDPTVDESKK